MMNIIIETKAYDRETNITPDEDTKISCAEEFFNAMKEEGYNVDFRKQIKGTAIKTIIEELTNE